MESHVSDANHSEMKGIEKIEHWRKVFDLPVLRTPNLNLDREEVYLSMNLIKEEFNELTEAFGNKDVTEVVDAIGDLYFVITQLSNVLGIDPFNLIDKIYESNMSKLCSNRVDAIKSVEKYKEQGIECNFIEIDDDRYIIKRVSDNKVLKGIGYFEPDIKSVIEPELVTFRVQVFRGLLSNRDLPSKELTIVKSNWINSHLQVIKEYLMEFELDYELTSLMNILNNTDELSNIKIEPIVTSVSNVSNP